MVGGHSSPGCAAASTFVNPASPPASCMRQALLPSWAGSAPMPPRKASDCGGSLPWSGRPSSSGEGEARAAACSIAAAPSASSAASLAEACLRGMCLSAHVEVARAGGLMFTALAVATSSLPCAPASSRTIVAMSATLSRSRNWIRSAAPAASSNAAANAAVLSISSCGMPPLAPSKRASKARTYNAIACPSLLAVASKDCKWLTLSDSSKHLLLQPFSRCCTS
mmetsp:Transcript_42167/g.111138  ORF Transcript_42167/g.111138 Transcript_42167/m.111138 type:complete len:224 (-) Transcript_42167:763-1434(-)